MKMAFFAIYLFFLITLAFANDDESHSDLVDAAKSINLISERVKEVGQIKKFCNECDDKSVNKSYFLTGSELTIDTPYYLRKVEPYLVNFKRTKETPNKIKIKFKNSQRVCGKLVSFSLPGGGLNMECLIYVSQYEDEEIEFDFSKLKDIKGNEVEIFQLILSKENSDKYKYNLELNSLNNEKVKIDKSKKFWGNGFNIKLEDNS